MDLAPKNQGEFKIYIMKTGPKYKICKRLGNNVFDKCQTQKFMLSEARKGRTSGKRGRPRSLSDYGVQLLEKQKVRFTYGISEKQLSRYVKEAVQKKGTDPETGLFEKLESRLDNVVYRLGLATTRSFARQMVSHGHITVGGRKVTVPSYSISKGDALGIREGSRKKTLFLTLTDRLEDHKAPVWVTFNKKTLTAEVKGKPIKEEGDLHFNLSAVLEFYSR